MGCSPSKGKLFSKPEGPGPQNALLAEASQNRVESRPAEDDNPCLKPDGEENEPPPAAVEQSESQTTLAHVALDATSAELAEDMKEMEENVMPQETVNQLLQTGKVRKTGKRKKNKDKQQSIEKLRKSSIVQTKFDFPPHMVRAHKAAYTFLNPNISKYETLLGLLDQASQTQLSLQPMMTALVLRFEEINQALEEMAEEGELMLKEHGDYMALPSGMKDPAFMPARFSTDKANPTDLPPDLLQQLLQHSTEKMRLAGASVQALGDTTLEDAVEYFSSLSKLLVEKLQAKQVAEQRLTQVLVQVERAAVRKGNPEDSALHSEDSGIGGENESLTGSDRHRRHRGSAGSASCGSGANIRSATDASSRNLPNLEGHVEDGEEDEDDDDDDEEEEEDDDVGYDEEDKIGRKRSNSSPPDPSQSYLYMLEKYMQDEQPTVKRPLTAPEARPSSSGRCVNIVTELQKSQRILNQQMKKMVEIKDKPDSAGPHYNVYRSGLRRHSSSGSGGPFKTHKATCSSPMLAPQPPKRQSVRRLINTFSQGVDGRPGQSLANIPPHIRRPRKSGALLLSDLGNPDEGGSVINGNNNNNSWHDSKDDTDVDSLPPPPPEVLMDNSFISIESMRGHVEGSQEDSVRLPMIIQKTGVPQRLRACVPNVEVLPNRVGVRPKPLGVCPAQYGGQQPETVLDPQTERANCLYQQARKIIHLCNAAESPDKRNTANQSVRGPSHLRARLGQRGESSELHEGEMSNCSLAWTAPPVSRVRLPPSCPSVHHRCPSPPMRRPSSPSSPPRTVRPAVPDTEEILPSVSFSDARSVFCQKESQNLQAWTSSGGSVPVRPWGEAPRGRLPKRGVDTTVHRTQSEQRPSLTKDGSSTSTQTKKTEPGTTT